MNSADARYLLYMHTLILHIQARFYSVLSQSIFLTERYWWAKIINSVYFVLNDNIFRTRFGGGGADKY